MRIDVFSDTICPWCLIGKRRLGRVLAERPGLRSAVRWRAFQLNPTMPAEGMDRRRYLDLKFGGAEAARRIYEPIVQAGGEEGIPFRFEAIRRTPNTLQSHRVIRFAASRGRQDAVVEALFYAYFVRGRDIGNLEVLAAAAAEGGLDPDEARALLRGDGEAAAVEAEDAAARRAGIQGVPCFIFNGTYVLAGAQPPEVLLRMFDLAAQDEATPAAPAAGRPPSPLSPRRL